MFSIRTLTSASMRLLTDSSRASRCAVFPACASVSTATWRWGSAIVAKQRPGLHTGCPQQAPLSAEGGVWGARAPRGWRSVWGDQGIIATV